MDDDDDDVVVVIAATPAPAAAVVVMSKGEGRSENFECGDECAGSHRERPSVTWCRARGRGERETDRQR